MRHQLSCTRCRIKKRKCVPMSNKCYECIKSNCFCSFETLVRARVPLIQGSQLPLPDLPIILDVVKGYFQYLHGLPHTIFHEKSFLNAIEQRTVSHVLIYSLIGLAGQFSTAFKTSSMPNQESYRNESKRLLRNDCENFCLENVQAAILITNICFAQRIPNSELLYCAIGVRMGQALKLHQSKPNDSVILRETKCRVWWSLYMTDIWSSGNLSLSGIISGFNKTISAYYPLPAGELQFQKYDMSSEKKKNSTDDWRHVSIWAENIRLVRIYEQIKRLNSSSVSSSEKLQSHEIVKKVSELADKLEDWQISLPPPLKYNLTNLDACLKHGIGQMFISLHLGYHYYSAVLYFQFLDETQELTAFRRKYLALCIHHARSGSELIELCLGKRDCLPLFNTIGHLIVVYSSSLLHNLYFGDHTDRSTVTRLLQSNIRGLNILKSYWGNVQSMIERLQTFQNVCKLFTFDAFTMDRWMMNFLLQYSISEENTDDVSALIHISNLEEPVKRNETMRLADDLISSLTDA